MQVKDKKENTKQVENLLRSAYEKGYQGATLEEVLEVMKKGLKNLNTAK
ncbi:hypothetical protein [Ornithinibacillus halophilus]|uniref:Uncharacterized protein n=1 Tax=Ornithinibacillus halophilus TaxID=930117 RepID=A0A1M5NH77_9BACI|nr:hypothetical protein [Ornithinibacillus halophilus]SHG88852.1 hypothetical protein SAMN05216225_10801 [Ornithinibacillus halophilus]